MDQNRVIGWAVLILLLLLAIVVPVTAKKIRRNLRKREHRRQLEGIRNDLISEGIDPGSSQGKSELHSRLKVERGKSHM